MTAIEIGLVAISVTYEGGLCEYRAESVVSTNIPNQHTPFHNRGEIQTKASNNFRSYIRQGTEHALTASDRKIKPNAPTLDTCHTELNG
jgi:hypothetical protein